MSLEIGCLDGAGEIIIGRVVERGRQLFLAVGVWFFPRHVRDVNHASAVGMVSGTGLFF